MSFVALVVGLLLTGQLGSTDSRYAQPGNSLGARRSDSAAAASGNTQSGGLVPVIEAPAATGSQRSALSSPTARTESPFSPPPNSLNTGTQGQYPPSSVSPPPARSTAAQTPWGTYPSQTSSTAATTTPVDSGTGLKPTAMMRAIFAAPRDSRLSGNSISLSEVVAGAPSRDAQSQRVDAYWDLCSSVADYYLSLRELDELRRLSGGAQRPGSGWQQAEAELAVRVGTSQRAALASQYHLANLLGRGIGYQPLPADLFHCGDYQCRYSEIFGGRQSTEAQELSQLLPQRYTELKDAAAGVTRAEEFLDSAAGGRNAAADETTTLRALELLALRRRAFVQIARDYNRRIARYCELAAPGQVNNELLIGMLIRRPGQATATRPAVPDAPFNRQSNNTTDPANSTFAEGWSPADKTGTATKPRDSAIQPASGESPAEPGQERSLLVTPQ